MVTVPTYQQTETLRPNYRQGIDVRATPDDFGAAIGRGMQTAAQGVSQLASSMQAVKELDDTMRAKDADNAYANWARERMYGENGFMTLEGRSAVDARAAFERDAEEKRKEFGQGLVGGAAKTYQTASQARLQSMFQQSIVHSANERKTWFKASSGSRVETFANDALVNYNKPGLVDKNIGAGILELRERGHMEGWDADTLKAKEAEFVSGVRKNITLRLAQDDPLAADKYMKDNAGQLTGAHQYELRNSLETEINNEQSKREADAILGGGRKVADMPGDIVGEVAGVTPERSAGAAGPTKARAYLYDRLVGKSREHVDGLDQSFATNLAAMIDDAPPGIKEGLGIYSGFRSKERQAELFAGAVAKYGSPAAARKWVAPPGNSYHNHGEAVDLAFNGQSLQHAPKEVVDWVHQNAGKYGLYFPMAHEPWHVEPMGTRGTAAADNGVTSGPVSTVAPRSNGIAPRSLAPSYADIEDRLNAIPNEKVRDLTRKRIYAQLEAQSKAQEQQEKAAKAELWKYVDQGKTPDQVPMEIRQAAGMSAVSSAWGYLETAAKGRAVQSDETLLYDMRRYAASNPTEFANIDLNDYRDRLSKETIKELTGLQTTALTDQRKAKQDGLNLTTAFSQADSQLEAIGITTTGKEGTQREEAAKRIAAFQNALASEMEAFKRLNSDRAPTQPEIQQMVNKLLLPIVIKEQRSGANPLSWFGSSTSDTSGKFMFEAGSRPDGSSVDVVVKYEDIPIDLRRGIAIDLERELGRKPSPDEVVSRYENFVLNR